jgi:hypothetical protein
LDSAFCKDGSFFGSEDESNVSEDFGLAGDFSVHDEVFASVAVWRECAGGDVLEALNDGLNKMMVTVLPDPFLPQMRVRGLRKSIFWKL